MVPTPVTTYQISQHHKTKIDHIKINIGYPWKEVKTCTELSRVESNDGILWTLEWKFWFPLRRKCHTTKSVGLQVFTHANERLREFQSLNRPCFLLRAGATDRGNHNTALQRRRGCNPSTAEDPVCEMTEWPKRRGTTTMTPVSYSGGSSFKSQHGARYANLCLSSYSSVPSQFIAIVLLLFDVIYFTKFSKA